MEAELNDLKQQLADIEKKAVSGTSRIGGLTQRPNTAMRANDSKRLGIDNGDSAKTDRKINGSTAASGLKRPTTALIAGSRLAAPSKLSQAN